MTQPSDWHEEDGFKFRLFPAKTAKAESVVIYMHGVGSSPDDIADEYIKRLQQKVPGADVIALQAPIKIRKSTAYPDPHGYSWFPLIMSLKSETKMWLTHIFNRLPIAEKVENFAKKQLTKRGLTEDNLAYYGHSMGGIVALQAGLTGKKPVAAIVSLAGSVMPFTQVKNNSKVFLQMGEKDDLFNAPPMPMPEKGFLKQAFVRAAEFICLGHHRSVERLKGKVPLTEKVYPNLTHENNVTMWEDGVDFIAKALSKPGPKPKAA
jgi:predicted esterase